MLVLNKINFKEQYSEKWVIINDEKNNFPGKCNTELYVA